MIHRHIGEEVALDPREKKKLKELLTEFHIETKEELEDIEESARQAISFLAGNHFEAKRSSEDEGKTPEELGGRDRIYPNVPYMLSRIDKMVETIVQDSGAPEVKPRHDRNFDIPKEHPFAALSRDPDVQAAFGAVGHNALVAKICEARLIQMLQQIQWTEIEDELIETAMLEKVACLVVGHTFSPEYIGSFADLVAMGDFGYDPKARKGHAGRWCFYVERSRPWREVTEAYGKPRESDEEDEGEETGEPDDGSDAQQRSYGDKGYGVDSKGDRAPHPYKLVDVFHWWIRNYDTTEVETEIEEVIEGPEGNETRIEKQVEEVPLYKGGWQYVVVAADRVLFNGTSASPTGAPPLHFYQYRKLIRKVTGLSFYDITKDLNKSADRLLQYQVEAGYKLQPKIVVDEAKVKNANQLMENTVGGFVKAKVEGQGSLDDVMKVIPGGGGAGDLGVLMDKTIAMADEFSGTAGVDVESVTEGQLSGDAIEGISSSTDRDGTASRARRRFRRFKEEVFEDMLRHDIAYNDQPVTLEVEVQAGQKMYVDVTMSMLAMQDTGAVPEWYVSIEEPRNMPKNLVRRAQYLMQQTQSIIALAGLSPGAAKRYIKIAELPFKKEYVELVQELEAAAAGSPGSNGPTEDERKASAEAQAKQAQIQMEVQKIAALSTADVYEEALKVIAKVDPESAMKRVGELHAAVMAAFGMSPVQPAPSGPAALPPEALAESNTGGTIPDMEGTAQ